MNRSSYVLIRLRFCLASLIGVAVLLCLTPAVSAQMVTIGGAMEGNLPVNPGDTIRAGYDFTMPGNHPGTTVTVTTGIVQMNVVCPDGSAQTLTITLPVQSYTRWAPMTTDGTRQPIRRVRWSIRARPWRHSRFAVAGRV